MTIQGGLPGGTVHVWRTSPASADPAGWVLRRADVTFDATGSFAFGCEPGYIYSFTSRSYRLNWEGHVTDRYTKAVSQLGDESSPVRIGGVYAWRPAPAQGSRPARRAVIPAGVDELK